MRTGERVTLQEAADALGISEQTARRWVKSGKLKAYRPGLRYLIPASAVEELLEEAAPKAAPRHWSGLSEEEKEARRREHDWTRILSSAFERILVEEKKHIKADWNVYPDPERVKETYSLLNQFEKAGGPQGSERLGELIGHIQKVLTSIDRMDLHRDDPIPAEEERHRERFGRPEPDDRAFPQDDDDTRPVEEAN